MLIIDPLSGHYSKEKRQGNVLLALPQVRDLEKSVKVAIKRGYTKVIIDTVSGLLNYNPEFLILHFINNISKSSAEALLIASTESYSPEENKKLISDLRLFCSEVVEA